VYASATVVHHGGHAASRNVGLRAGLWTRFQLSRRVSHVVHGAAPTRRA
jgi:hypothetical protein